MKCTNCNFRNTPRARYCVQCGAELTPSGPSPETVRSSFREIERGTILFGRYEVIEEIGSGGMGSVYRVVDQQINEVMALKIIRPDIAMDSEVIERFTQELKTARKIAHRNVCRMFDIGEDEGTHYITMEYVTGEDLRSLVRRIGQMTVAKTIDIAKQICAGLAEAHAVGVIHRDLKPQNIMIDRNGNVKIMDFGIARFVRTKGITTTGTVIGTPEYMSPEQAEGKGVDQRSDIYSLGVVLFEAATGAVPFEGETPLSVAMKHKLEAVPDPRRFNAQIPADLSGLILKCLEKEKEDRYQTVAEIISDLESISQEATGRQKGGKSGTEKRRSTTRKVARKKSGFEKALIPGAAILLMAALAFGAWKIWLQGKPPGGEIAEPGTVALETGAAEKAAEKAVETPAGQAQVPGSTKEEPPAGAEAAKSGEVTPGGGAASEQKVPSGAAAGDEAGRQSEIAESVASGLAAAQKAFDRGSFQECLNRAQAVLKLDPQNSQARNYAVLAGEKLAETEIGSLVDQYAQALNTNGLIQFYRMRCTPKLFEEIGQETELFVSLYENFQCTTSNKTVRVTARDRAEATFTQRLLGTRKGTGSEQELSRGTVLWNLERQERSWKISKIEFKQ
jgi:serine/threonine protein kinase